MERAIHEEWVFWVTGVPTICMLGYLTFGEVPSGRGSGFVQTSLIGVSVMLGCAYRGFRALKREITDLKSGGTDDSTAPQDSE
jgi:hypothetical protein